MKSSARFFREALVVAGLALVLLAGRGTLAQELRDEFGDLEGQGERVRITAQQALSKALDLVAALEREAEVSDQEEGDTSERLERYQEARRLANVVLANDPINVTAGYVLGRLALLTGRPREALAWLESYVKDPVGQNDWYAYKLLGGIYLVSYAEHARSAYRKAVELAPTEPKALIGLAQAELRLRRADEAIDNARKAIQFDGESTPAYRAVLARALLLTEERQRACDAAREAVALAERRVRQAPGRAALLYETKEYYELLAQCLTEALSDYPEKADYVVELVQTRLDLADLERLLSFHTALASLERAREHPDLETSGELLYEQARLNRLIGKNEEAVKLIEQIPESDAAYQAAQQLLQLIRPSDHPEAPSPAETASAAP